MGLSWNILFLFLAPGLRVLRTPYIPKPDDSQRNYGACPAFLAAYDQPWNYGIRRSCFYAWPTSTAHFGIRRSQIVQQMSSHTATTLRVRYKGKKQGTVISDHRLPSRTPQLISPFVSSKSNIAIEAA